MRNPPFQKYRCREYLAHLPSYIFLILLLWTGFKPTSLLSWGKLSIYHIGKILMYTEHQNSNVHWTSTHWLLYWMEGIT